MKLEIVGNGKFGTFLKDILSPYVSIENDAEDVILAVPFEAYEQVASKYRGKHLVNVCSVQRDTNIICSKYSDLVTGFHPLFGPNSLKSDRVALLTHSCVRTKLIIDLFEKLGVDICSNLEGGEIIDGDLHDKMMAVTHLAGMRVSETLKEIVDEAQWVPDKFVPPSFQRIREFVFQCKDFSSGTASSIKANPYGKK